MLAGPLKRYLSAIVPVLEKMPAATTQNPLLVKMRVLETTPAFKTGKPLFTMDVVSRGKTGSRMSAPTKGMQSFDATRKPPTI